MYEGVVLGGGYSGYPGNVYLIFGATSILFGQLVGDAMDLCGHNSEIIIWYFKGFIGVFRRFCCGLPTQNFDTRGGEIPKNFWA